MTAWRRLRDWQGAGVWERLHGELLRRLNAPGSDPTGRGPPWTPARSALFKGALTGPSPADRGRAGTKHHLIVDATGIPLFGEAWAASGSGRQRTAPAIRRRATGDLPSGRRSREEPLPGPD